MTVTFGDHYLAMELPDELDYGFRENGAMMAYVSGNDALNLHVSTVTVTPKDPSRTTYVFDDVVEKARQKGFECRIIGADKAVYSYIESGKWERYEQRLYYWIVGCGVREIIFTASCLIDHPDYEQVKPILEQVPEMIASIRPAEAVA